MTVDPSRPYTITMAPRVVKGKVIIGNGGAELGVRGYVSAYDAETGAQVWRFYTVPGDPAQPYETPDLAAAAKTWDPSGKYWKQGGGGTVWNAVAFDPDLDLLYVGTGNGSPWSKHFRSPKRRRQPLSLLDPRAASRHRRSSSGTTRRRPATCGTTRRRRTSCSRISRSAARCAR